MTNSHIAPLPAAGLLTCIFHALDEAYLQFQSLCQSAPVNRADLKILRALLKKSPAEGSFLHESEYAAFDEKNEWDLTSLSGCNKEKDQFSKWIDNLLTKVYHEHIGEDIHRPFSVVDEWSSRYPPIIHNYPDRYIARAVDILSTILSSLLPTIGALGLVFVKDPLKQMGVIIVLGFLFSSTLAVLARARRIDVFAATAAFMAVLVVFVRNNKDCGC